MKSVSIAVLIAGLLAPTHALAWGSEGHVLVAAIARSRLTPETLAKVDAILAQDKDQSTPSDMLSRSYWADIWRKHGHRETALWHYADIELITRTMTLRATAIPPAPSRQATARPKRAWSTERRISPGSWAIRRRRQRSAFSR